MTMQRTPYGRRAVEVLGSLPAPDAPPTYYERPALKASDWRWLIVTYFWIGGLAGAAQVIAGVADVVGHERDRKVVAVGRYLALLGALVSPVFLIADLKTPSRWFNMLRVFRSTSPMSIGSWTLFAFGSFSGLAALGHILEDVFSARSGRSLARAAGIPAAVSGALLATYTGTLLSATSTPLWATGYKLLPALFGVSGTATATAALSLVLDRCAAPRGARTRVERLGLAANCLELALTLRLDALWKRAQVAGPLAEPPLAAPYRFGVLGLGIAAPLAVHALQVVTRRELRRASMLASIAALVGGYTLRAVMIFAGERSAERPRDYFRIAQ